MIFLLKNDNRIRTATVKMVVTALATNASARHSTVASLAREFLIVLMQVAAVEQGRVASKQSHVHATTEALEASASLAREQSTFRILTSATNATTVALVNAIVPLVRNASATKGGKESIAMSALFSTTLKRARNHQPQQRFLKSIVKWIPSME